jgi:hypothetical protein
MTEYLCKDCIHSRCSKIYTFFHYIIEFKAPGSYSYRCAKSPSGEKITFNPVTGNEKVKVEMERCETMRRSFVGEDRCGPEAKYWTPKKKKDLFKMLTKD